MRRVVVTTNNKADRKFAGILYNFSGGIIVNEVKRDHMASMIYPIGIQDFGKLRRMGFAYVDKTMYVRKMIASRLITS